MKRSILFDMDGTLFQTESVALPAFHHAFDMLFEKGLYQGERPSDERMLKQLGKTLDELWRTLLPGTDFEVHQLADEWMFQHEYESIISKKGSLFPGAEEVIQMLNQKGYLLFITSNGREDYVQAILDSFQLTPYFTDLYTAGRFKTKSKVDLVRMLLQTYPTEQGVMVGDRRSDVEAGKENGLKVIGCKFGFADPDELDHADYVITSLQEIPSILE